MESTFAPVAQNPMNPLNLPPISLIKLRPDKMVDFDSLK
ncbi:hypothetical protein A2U01_0097076, partial [Trifolium medium]|nr:hypothetical protein [Trifolium medium]